MLTFQPLLYLFYYKTPFFFLFLYSSLIHAWMCFSSVLHGISWMFTHCHFICVCARARTCSGPKGPQKITNWGPAAFTDAELSLRERNWQERKNRPAQTQWGIIAVLPAKHSCTSNHYWMGKHWPSGLHSAQADLWNTLCDFIVDSNFTLSIIIPVIL